MFEIRFTTNGRSQSISVFDTMEHAEKFLKLCDKPNTRPKGHYDIVPVTLEELRQRQPAKSKK